MNPNLFVSIIMPAFNAEETIRDSIRSVLSQTYQNWELIIVDDASTDSTYQIVEDFVQRDSRILLLRNPHNRGVSFSRNQGIRAAQGSWIAFLDSDDMWMPKKLEKQVRVAAAPATPPPAPASQTSASQTPASQTSASQTPASQTSASQTPASQTSASQTPTSQTPAPQTPASRAPAPPVPSPQAPASPALVYTGSQFLLSSGKHTAYRLHVPPSISYRELLKQNVISCSSVLVRKELLLQYPMRHDNMHEDYAVWLQILKNGFQARGIDEPLLIYRLSHGSKSGHKSKAAIMTYRVYRFMGLGHVQALYYFMWYAAKSLKKYFLIRRRTPLRL